MVKKIKVLVVDDSALVRQLMTEILNSDNRIEVVGAAHDPFDAREKIKKLNPDVLTLDVEMPKMDGITFLRNLMRLRPMPVVMVSTLTEAGADTTLQAMEYGAFDFVTKPKSDLRETLDEYTGEIVGKVKAAAAANLDALTRNLDKPAIESAPKYSADAVLDRQETRHFRTTDTVIAIGASTGGTEAIKDVLTALPADSPGIVITQHIPAAFSQSFAERMDRLSAVRVVEARDGDQVIPGHAFIAPGHSHLYVDRDGARYICRLSDGPPVNRHKPSVDVLFRSMAQKVGPNGIGVILTGMGDDGAKGLKEMQEAGASTIAQDEKSSVVWGMPGEAVALGAADEILSLNKIAHKLISLVSK